MDGARKLEQLAAASRELAPETLAEALGKPDAAATLRSRLEQAKTELEQQFLANEPVDRLVAAHSDLVDHAILACWRHHCGAILEAVDLVAVGGYGRGELHPHSDIDLLILLGTDVPDGADEGISRFLTFLWDIGLEVGQSVRTLHECAEQAAKDVTVLTTLMETRLLAGPGELFAQLPDCISQDTMWSAEAFFRAKTKEQVQRHGRYHDTAYNLEPTVKGSPGGLRDIQMIGWIARRHLGTTRLEELVDHGYLTEGQLRILLAGQSFLWRIRYGLHLLTGRREDRLLFDHQIKLAKMLGYEDASFTLGVEQLMQRYYRTVMELSRLNEMLLQLFEEAIVLDADEPPVELSPHFQARNGYLEAKDENVFTREPSALLEIFLLLEKNLSLRGVNARTIALIRQHLWLIDEEFRQNPRHHRLFLEILKAPQGVTRTLKRMNTYGVLGLYIPAFGRIVGRMQYDLFHAYTVDQHTLFVVENLRRMSLPRFNDEHPNGSAIMQSLDKPEIAYLAGMFHDIAKGRGGDHSELGAVDAESFCLEHVALRRAARGLARAPSSAALADGSEEGHQRPERRARVRQDARRREAPRVSLRAHGRGPARDEPEDLELVERHYGSCSRARSARSGAATRTRSTRTRSSRRRRERRARCSTRQASPPRTSTPSGATSTRSTSCATAPRRSPGIRACWPRRGPRKRRSSTSRTRSPEA